MKNIRIITTAAIFSFCFSIYAQESGLGKTSPDGCYEIFLNEKDIDNNSRYFESFIVDKINGDTFSLATNYKNDSIVPNWFWDKESRYLIFEGREFGSISKIQVWDLEDRFLLYELRGSIPVERTETSSLWDCKNEILTFHNFENVEAPEQFTLDLKTRKVTKKTNEATIVFE